MYRIIDNTKVVFKNIETNASVFLRNMADEIINIATPKTPKKTGRLRMDVIRQVLGLNGKVKWGKNYAKYQETKQFKNYTTPGTGSGFAEKSVREAITKTSEIARRSKLI